ncbi:FxSxx-COOH system tetratricopeptide repeat protein [Streptomyces sp. NPDC051001]|uniref:FxSxx-COOH system tetratricopeptide repeat protein n=1 Tax=Streptomyces sp. NPDC051001 TaxID=3155795 RepID=UPI00341319DA
MADTGASDGTSDRVWFISHAGADRAWAEWVGWQLLDAGHQVELDYWDWGAGDNFVLKMNAALERGRLLALFSPAYFEPERFTTPEWTAVVAMREKITPVRIDRVDPPAILRPLLSRDLFDLDPVEARRVLLEAVGGPSRPDAEPPFPGARGVLRQVGASGPRLPGSLPRVWNLPARNAAFTGRDTLLVHLRQALVSRNSAHALYGRGGVGKTQLAMEYAYRFAGEYELAWWIPAEDPALIPGLLAALAVRIGAAPAGTPDVQAVEELLAELRSRSRWLLVFDNAEDPDALAPFLPGGPGHVLISSRNPHWNTHAVPLAVDNLSRTESVALLRSLGAVLADVDADDIAATLDDLPLALAQAAALLTVHGLSAADLKAELARSTAEVLDADPPDGYPVSLAAQVRVTTARLAAGHPGAAALLAALALLAPEPFPATHCTGNLPTDASPPLQETCASRLAAGKALRAIGRHSLARVHNGTLQLHRLTQEILKGQMTSPELGQALADAEALLAAANPGDSSEPRFWPAWQALLPHALAIDPARLTTGLGRFVVLDACWYLMDRGQANPARERLQRLYDSCLQKLGPDHYNSLQAANNLARAYNATQDHERARALDEDTLARRRRLYGDDDPDTLTSAHNLAVRLRALGRYEEALTLSKETLEVLRRVFGSEHQETLLTAIGLAIRLADVGRVEEAVVLGEETLEVQRRVVGLEHPTTLSSAYNLALWLADVGRVEEAVVLGEETLEARRRVVGLEHPDTLSSASNLAVDLAGVGRVEEAVVLGQEALAGRRRVLGVEHPDTLRTAYNLALWLADVGRVGEAVVLGEETLEVQRGALGEGHADTQRTAGWLESLGEAPESPGAG